VKKLLALAPLLAFSAVAEPAPAWRFELTSTSVAQAVSRVAEPQSALATTYYSAKAVWQTAAWWMLRGEVEGGQVIGHHREEQLAANVGSQWSLNEMQEDPAFFVPVLHFAGTSADGRLGWQVGKISPKNTFDDNRAARSKRTKFLAEPFVRNAAVPFAGKGLGGALRWEFSRGWQVGLSLSDANAVGSKAGFTTWRGEWFRAAELTWRPDARGAVRVLAWGTEKRGAHDDGWGVSADREVAPHWIVFARAGGGSRHFAHSQRFGAAGVAWEGPFGRGKDYLGLGVAGGRAIGDDRTEWRGELFYRWQVNRVLALTPDLQFIGRPARSAVSSAWAFGLRCTLFLRESGVARDREPGGSPR